MSTRRTAFHKHQEAAKSTVPNIDNREYIVRTVDGRTIYTWSKTTAEYQSRQGSEVFRRIRWYEDDI